MVFFSTCFVPHVCIVSFTPCRTALKGRWYSPYLTSEETEAQRSRRNREKEVCFFHYVSGPLEKPSFLKVVGRITRMWKEKSNRQPLPVASPGGASVPPSCVLYSGPGHLKKAHSLCSWPRLVVLQDRKSDRWSGVQSKSNYHLHEL